MVKTAKSADIAEVKELKSKKSGSEDFLREMLRAGVHFGHHTSRWHPTAASFIFTERGGIHIINLEKTAEALEEAKKYLEEFAKEGKLVLLVATKKQIRETSEKIAKETGLFYMTERWMGGLLTNFTTIKTRLKRMKTLEEQFKTGEINKYVKKERFVLRNELEKLNKDLGGIKEMLKMPDVLVVVDAKAEQIAIREATALGIPVVALVDTNNDTTGLAHAVPGNDDAPKSVELLLTELLSGVKKYSTNKVLTEEKEVKKSKEEVDEGLEALEEAIEEKTDQEELEEKKIKKAKGSVE